MHVYPMIVVDGCGSQDEAREKAQGRSEELAEAGVYDYGGPMEETRNEPTVLMAGTAEYREAVLDALETERGEIREYWTILKQAVKRFGDREHPPASEEIFKAEFEVGVGIAGLIESGTRLRREISFGSALYRAAKLDDLLRGAPSVARFLYDFRKDTKAAVADEAKPDAWAVACDFHY